MRRTKTSPTNWWLPRWLDRAIPRLRVEAEPALGPEAQPALGPEAVLTLSGASRAERPPPRRIRQREP
ncbi:MAG TPA: hypothetical protein VET24_11430 [Actinomycetota bacterium]|nr:hypothetical protein [Actinomycetota bacterium]